MTVLSDGECFALGWLGYGYAEFKYTFGAGVTELPLTSSFPRRRESILTLAEVA